MSDLKIGTRLSLIDPEGAVSAPIAEHERSAWVAPQSSCSHCATCVGLPEGSDYPWNEIAVIAWDAGAGDGELIVAPVVWSALSTPRRVQIDDLLDLYEIVADGTEADGWETPAEEVV